MSGGGTMLGASARSGGRFVRLTLSPCHLVTLSLLLAGCDPDLPGKPSRADEPVYGDKVLDFKQLYSDNCAGCHGRDGQLGPAPPLNDMVFRQIVSDEDLTETITMGRPGTPMPAFAKKLGGSLTDAQIQV